MLNPIEKFKVAILHLNRACNHWSVLHMNKVNEHLSLHAEFHRSSVHVYGIFCFEFQSDHI